MRPEVLHRYELVLLHRALKLVMSTTTAFPSSGTTSCCVEVGGLKSRSFTFHPSVKDKTGPPSPQMIANYQPTKDAHKSTMLSQQAKTYSQGNAEAAALPS